MGRSGGVFVALVASTGVDPATEAGPVIGLYDSSVQTQISSPLTMRITPDVNAVADSIRADGLLVPGTIRYGYTANRVTNINAIPWLGYADFTSADGVGTVKALSSPVTFVAGTSLWLVGTGSGIHGFFPVPTSPAPQHVTVGETYYGQYLADGPLTNYLLSVAAVTESTSPSWHRLVAFD